MRGDDSYDDSYTSAPELSAGDYLDRATHQAAAIARITAGLKAALAGRTGDDPDLLAAMGRAVWQVTADARRTIEEMAERAGFRQGGD